MRVLTSLAASAGPEWQHLAAAAMSMRIQELPQNQEEIVRLLHETIPSYVQQLLGSQKWANLELLNELLVQAVLVHSAPAVTSILSAAPTPSWTLQRIEVPLQHAVHLDETDIFQNLVAAAALACPNDYWFHSHVLKCAVNSPYPLDAAHRACITWLLEFWKPNWRPHHLEPSLAHCFSDENDHNVLRQLLFDTGVQWIPAQLIRSLEAAASRGLVREVQLLLMAPGVQWLPSDLVSALADATAGAADVLKGRSYWIEYISPVPQFMIMRMLMRHPGVQWTSSDLLPSVRQAAAASSPCLLQVLLGDMSAWEDLGDDIVEWIWHLRVIQWEPFDLGPLLKGAVVERRVQVLKILLAAGGKRWKGVLLGPCVTAAVHIPGFNYVLKLLLYGAGDIWTSQDLHPALLESARFAAKWDNWHQYDMMLKFPGVQWEAGHLVSILGLLLDMSQRRMKTFHSAMQHKWYSRVKQVLAVPGVEWQPQHLQDVLSLAYEMGDEELIRQCGSRRVGR